MPKRKKTFSIKKIYSRYMDRKLKRIKSYMIKWECNLISSPENLMKVILKILTMHKSTTYIPRINDKRSF